MRRGRDASPADLDRGAGLRHGRGGRGLQPRLPATDQPLGRDRRRGPTSAPGPTSFPSPFGYRPISTRAITIEAPPEEVWPWLVQMGSGRAGFYTHEWVERLLFITYADGHSSTRIHPEWQDLHVGDRVPYSRFNTVEVTMIDLPRCLVAGEWPSSNRSPTDPRHA